MYVYAHIFVSHHVTWNYNYLFLNNNDIIVLFTDGINEAVNEDFDEYGYNRLEEIIKNNSELAVEEISNRIMKSVTTFSRNNSQHDDITLVLFKWKSHTNYKGDY